MEHGYEKILEVQRRCGVSFEEADRAMKFGKGDVDKACAFAFRRKNKDLRNKGWFIKTINALSNFLTYRIKISKNSKVKFDIPMGIILVISLFVLIISSGRYYRYGGLGIIFFCVFAVTVLTGYSLEFAPAPKKEEVKLEKAIIEEKKENQVFEEYHEDEVDEAEDGYNTIEID